MKQIYLDNSATTPLSEAAIAAMSRAMECYGNPSSLHPVGQAAHTLLEDARRAILQTLGLRGTHESGQLFFTSCGSEADNLALFGTAYAKARRRGGRIITTDSEHAGGENVMQALEKDGFDVVRISTRGGELDWAQYENALNDRTFLVSMMMVNNETGALYDLSRAFAMAKAHHPDVVTPLCPVRSPSAVSKWQIPWWQALRARCPRRIRSCAAQALPLAAVTTSRLEETSLAPAAAARSIKTAV